MFKERSKVLGRVGIKQVCKLEAQLLVERADKNGVGLIFNFMGCTDKAGAFVAGCSDLRGKVSLGVHAQAVLAGAESGQADA